MTFLHVTVTTLLTLAALGLCGWRVLVCEHPHELFDRFPDGRPALRCTRCMNLRPNIMLGTPQYRRTQEGGPIFARALAGRAAGHSMVTTGIERVWAELERRQIAGSRRYAGASGLALVEKPQLALLAKSGAADTALDEPITDEDLFPVGAMANID